jgi:hypothetical protein
MIETTTSDTSDWTSRPAMKRYTSSDRLGHPQPAGVMYS